MVYLECVGAYIYDESHIDCLRTDAVNGGQKHGYRSLELCLAASKEINTFLCKEETYNLN